MNGIIESKPDKVLKWGKAVLEVLAFLGLLAYVCETRKTNNLTQRALENSKIQFAQSQDVSKTQFNQAQSTSWKQFVTDQRPYVWLTNDLGPFTIASHSSGNTSEKLAFNFHFTNYGKSPAIYCRSEGRIVFGKNAENTIYFRSLDPKGGTIIPPRKDAFNTAWSDSPVDPALLTRIQTAGTIEYVTVSEYIQYSDTSGNTYSSEFCLQRNPGPGITFCKDHNSIK